MSSKKPNDDREECRQLFRDLITEISSVLSSERKYSVRKILLEWREALFIFQDASEGLQKINSALVQVLSAKARKKHAFELQHFDQDPFSPKHRDNIVRILRLWSVKRSNLKAWLIYVVWNTLKTWRSSFPIGSHFLKIRGPIMKRENLRQRCWELAQKIEQLY